MSFTRYFNPADPMMLARCYARLDPRTRDRTFEPASKQPNYALMYPSDEPEDERTKQNGRWKRQQNNAGRMSSLNCIRAAEANADAANGQVLDEVFEGKRLVDLADGITAVPSLSSDDISAYAFVRNTGELVQSTEGLRRQVEEALAARAAAAGNQPRTPTNAEEEHEDDDDDDDDDEDAAAAAGFGAEAGAGAGAGAGIGGGDGSFATPPSRPPGRRRGVLGGANTSGSSGSGRRRSPFASFRLRRLRVSVGGRRIGSTSPGSTKSGSSRDTVSPRSSLSYGGEGEDEEGGGHGGVDPPAAGFGGMQDLLRDDDDDGGANGDEDDEYEGIAEVRGGLRGNGGRSGGDDRRRRDRGGGRRDRGRSRRRTLVGPFALGRGDDVEVRALQERIVKLERALQDERNANEIIFDCASEQRGMIFEDVGDLREQLDNRNKQVDVLKKQVSALKTQVAPLEKSVKDVLGRLEGADTKEAKKSKGGIVSWWNFGFVLLVLVAATVPIGHLQKLQRLSSLIFDVATNPEFYTGT